MPRVTVLAPIIGRRLLGSYNSCGSWHVSLLINYSWLLKIDESFDVHSATVNVNGVLSSIECLTCYLGRSMPDVLLCRKG